MNRNFNNSTPALWSLFPCPLSYQPMTRTQKPQITRINEEPEDVDGLCMQSIAEGDQEAFANIVERWQSRLINFFYKSTHNQADAEDLAQETFLGLYRSAPRYQHRGSFSAYVFTLGRRRLIDSHRKRARRPLDYIDPTDFTMEQKAEEADEIREIKEAFHRALADLPENQRNAVLLLQQQGLSYEEISKSLDASLSSVKTWIHRARTQLRERLKDFYQAS